jgi:hypothetical protein
MARGERADGAASVIPSSRAPSRCRQIGDSVTGGDGGRQGGAVLSRTAEPDGDPPKPAENRRFLSFEPDEPDEKTFRTRYGTIYFRK